MNVFSVRPTVHSPSLVHWLSLVCLLVATAIGPAAADASEPLNIPESLSRDQLVAWCTVVFDKNQRGPDERAELLSDLGITRSAYEWRARHVDSFEDEIKAYQNAGIEFFSFWGWHDAFAPLVKKYDIRPQIWLTNPSPQADTQSERVAQAALDVLPIVRKANQLGLEVALYNHMHWGGEPENLVAVCKQLQHEHGLDNVGICYNFHHGHEHTENFAERFRVMLPYLMCVNLNGVDDPDSIDVGDLKQKIRPIGSGEYEAEMLRAVLKCGYDGPFGILDHRPDLDARVALQKNLDGLESMVTSLDRSDPLYSAWAFTLPDGNPAWLKIGKGPGNKPQASLLWSVGSARPAKDVVLNGDTITFQRPVRWKPGGGQITKQVVGPMTGQLISDNQLRLTFGQRELRDGKPASDAVETIWLAGDRIPPPPTTPDLSDVQFGEPIQLFNGKDLTGWKLSRDDKRNGWGVEDGVLVNETPKTDFGAYGDYGNLVTEQVFDDFQLSLEYNVPPGGNSGVYLRGMYEAQVVDRDSKMQGIAGPGAIFGRLLPNKNAGNPGGQWNRYVLTLVDRHITVELNGQTVIDNELLEGCTGGGLQANDTLPGPIFLQGDHTAVRYRNIVLRPVVDQPPVATAKRPNVLIIYGDDQGSIDMGCFGVTDLETPNMDRLARGGLKLTQMYSAAPVCSASRVGLLTGRFPARAGQPGNGDLATEETTIAEAFRDSGYATGHVGKWHLGRSQTINPAGQGFQHWFGHLEGCIDNFSHFYYWSGPNRHDLWDNGREVHRPGEYFPELMVDRCKQFIDRQSDQPWLLYWAFNAPHYPYQGTPQWLEHYKDLPTPRREYCAFLSTMDEYIGQVLHHLEQRDLAENTIVIYQPDHGHSTETRAFGGGGNAGIYRGAKFSVFEGGIRVPSVVRFPKRLPAGQQREQFTTSCDWFPTLCQWCGVDTPDVKLDGVSIVDVLEQDADATRNSFYWQMGKGNGAQWAVRKESWKLIGNPRDTSLPQTEQVRGGRLKEDLFLANLQDDPGEKTNVADEHPQVVRELVEIRRQIVGEFDR